jgi:predicted Mrr-cat superfamily restriction endonuclease
VIGLIDENDWIEFKRLVANTYPDLATNSHKLGSAAGNLWRFIHDMSENDLAIVPDYGEFYVARVTGPVRYDVSYVADDTGHRRSVEWLNNRKPIPRGHASAGLQSRMKAFQTIAWASEFVDEINEILRAGDQLAVGDEIAHVVRNSLQHQLRHGRMNERLFEKFVAAMMKKVGCSDVKIIPRLLDQGADIVASHTGLNITLAAQVKFHNDIRYLTTSEAVDQLADGMEKESAHIGWVVTLGKFDENAEKRADELRTGEKHLVIRLIDGDELVKMAVEYGVPTQFADT